MSLKLTLIVIWVAFGLAGDVVIREGRPWLAPILWCVCVPPAIYCFKRAEFAWIGIVWTMVALLGALILAVCRYHEKLSARDWWSVVFAVVAIFLCSK